jgi:exopolysaccharide production protein ExoZ
MRIFTLDYLRAILALGIMFAHFSLWASGPGNASLVSTRLELYSVPMFYLLSGITLQSSYGNRLKFNLQSLRAFFSKRAMRLAPLFYLATFLTIVLFRQVPDASTLFTNLTGLFSVYKWERVIVYGGWALGNELVFYTAFPILLWIFRHSISIYIRVLGLLFLLYSYFAFIRLDNTELFIDQWSTYTNPLNQLFLFAAGNVISILFKDTKISVTYSICLIVWGFIIFCGFPVSGDRIQVVTGIPRLLFTLACILIITGIYNWNFQLPKTLHKGFMSVARSSYSVFLLHPIIYRILAKASSIALKYGISVPLTGLLIVSAFSTLITCHFITAKFALLTKIKLSPTVSV